MEKGDRVGGERQRERKREMGRVTERKDRAT
jgi:hypothetical protein